MTKLKKQNGNNAELLEEISTQAAEILALRAEIAKLKNNYSSLMVDPDEEIIPLKEILALMPGNIFWKDKNGKLLGCNNNNAKFFGFSSYKDMVGKYSKDFISEEFAEVIDKNDQEIMQSGQGRFLEECGLDLNNNPAYFFTQKIPLFDNAGKITGLLGIAIDITERKKIEMELKLAKEKAEALSQAKSQFLAVVNHELRTPLTSIMGLVNFLKQGKLNKEEEKNTVEDLENCAFYLLALVNDILDFSKLDAEKMNLSIHPLNLYFLINEVTRILNVLAKNKGLELRLHYDKNIPEWILSDEKTLRQIFVNIISNAIKFTDAGFIDVTINQLKNSKEKTMLEIIVSDTGRGIPKDKLEIIFEPFRQLEDIYIRQSSRGGTGLGLAIVKKLSDLLGLTITAMSEKGKGSSFILQGEFDISVKKTIFKTNQISENFLKQEYLQRKKTKALLIEDDVIVQRIHKSMLTDLGCEVDIASCGLDALKMIKDEYDILFVDIGLSDITGFEVIKSIREKQTKIFPIIALTGYTGDEERKKCIAAGANTVIEKPVSIERLQAILFDYELSVTL